MARHHVPAHWNAYRPSYSPPARTVPPYASEQADNHPNDASDHGPRNPNMIPLRPRHLTPTVTHSPPSKEPEDQVHGLWDTELDSLIGRTMRAYDLVLNYLRDCEGGQRWTSGDIAEIRHVGRHLSGDVRALNKWHRTVAEHGDNDQAMMSQIYEDAENLREYCTRIQAVIRERECLPCFVYEEGNLSLMAQHGGAGGFDEHLGNTRTANYVPVHVPQGRKLGAGSRKQGGS